MNKKLILSSIILLIVLLVLPSVGCQQQATPAPTPTPTPTPAPTPAPEPKSEPGPAPSPEPKAVELKYDDGTAEAVLPTEEIRFTGGYLVDFTPPSTPFTVKKVRILAVIAGGITRKDFEVEIWDSEKNVLYNTSQPVSLFPEGPNKPAWVAIDIPNIKVNGKFYVHMYTGGTGRAQGLQIGADDSIVNEHSSVTSIRADDGSVKEAQWPYLEEHWFGDKTKVTWMIRVVGAYLE